MTLNKKIVVSLSVSMYNLLLFVFTCKITAIRTHSLLCVRWCFDTVTQSAMETYDFGAIDQRLQLHYTQTVFPLVTRLAKVRRRVKRVEQRLEAIGCPEQREETIGDGRGLLTDERLRKYTEVSAKLLAEGHTKERCLQAELLALYGEEAALIARITATSERGIHALQPAGNAESAEEYKRYRGYVQERTAQCGSLKRKRPAFPPALQEQLQARPGPLKKRKVTSVQSDVMFNYTNQPIARPLIQLLTRGISFVPTYHNPGLIKRNYRDHLALTLKRWSSKNAGKDPVSTTVAKGAASGVLQQLTLSESKLRNASNISLSERYMLAALRRNRNIMLLEADKNLGVCLLTKTHYEELVQGQLSKAALYECTQQSEADTIADVSKRLNQLLEALVKHHGLHGISKSHIMRPEYDHPIDQLPQFTVIPKVHKNPLSVRPIVRGHSWVLTSLSKWLAVRLDQLRVQYEEKIGCAFVLENSLELVARLDRFNVSGAVSIITLDFDALYNNIAIGTALNCIAAVAAAVGHKHKAVLLKLTEFLLRNNYFKYKEAVYHQKNGVAMGTNCAVALANLLITYQTYVGLLGKNALPIVAARSNPISPVIIYALHTYIDDILVITPAERATEAQGLLKAIYPVAQPLNVTAVSNESANYLDLTVIVRQVGTNSTLTYKQFSNPLSKHQFVHFTSNVAPSMRRGIAIGGYCRALALNASEADRTTAANAHQAKLMRAGYPLRQYIMPLAAREKRRNRSEYLAQASAKREKKRAELLVHPFNSELRKGNAETLWYINTYHANADVSGRLRKEVQRALEEAGCQPLPRVRLVHLRARSIAELLKHK